MTEGHAASLPDARYMAIEADRLLDADEVAALFHVPVSWVRDHSRAGLIPHVKLGKYVRFRREAVLAWIVEQEQGGAVWRKHRPRVPAVENGGSGSPKAA